MIEIIVTPEQLEESSRMANEMGCLKHSIRGGAGNIYGFIGEIIVRDKYKCKAANTYEYDLISAKGNTIDVKTKATKVKPQPDFECSIVSYKKQSCDYYLFARVSNDKTRAWILGYISPEDYFAQAVFRKKGELDPNSSSRFPFYFTADCYNLPINKLKELN